MPGTRFTIIAVTAALIVGACGPASDDATTTTQPDPAQVTSSSSTTTLDTDASQDQPAEATETELADLFQELLGKSETEVDAKIEEAWQHFFYGDDETERVYYPVDGDMAYVLDVGNDDVRSEGISYGMMIAVQMDRQKEFDRIWKWAKTYMYHDKGHYEGYFAWHANTDGRHLDQNPASDGETWMTMALIFASNRWGDGEGIFDYATEANQLLDTMLHKGETAGAATSIFDPETLLIVFVPSQGKVSTFTDPSYHTPHYYEIWADWADQDNDLWTDIATASRAFLHSAEDSVTGLMPDYSAFSGEIIRYGNGSHERFSYDAWRTTMNIALDHAWNEADPWQVGHTDKILSFFRGEGMDEYVSQYLLDGTPMSEERGTGLIAVNGAGAAMAGTLEGRTEFVQALWDLQPPRGQWRYYDGLLYFMSLLMASGNFLPR